MKTLFVLAAALVMNSVSTFAADMPSVHGMLLFGKNKVYVSHLPMFHAPHDYQLLAELELPAEAEAIYKNSLKENPGETVYTLVPELFSLPEMVAKPRPFQAELVRGHFERGGSAIATMITVKLAKILFFRKFVPGEKKPATATYLLFGEKDDAYIAHYIASKPDFDQVLEVGLPDAAALTSGNAVRITTERSNLSPLSAPLQAEFLSVSNGLKFPITLQKELYFETGDLAH